MHIAKPLYVNPTPEYHFLGTFEQMDLYVTPNGDKLAARHGPKVEDIREFKLFDSDQYMKRRDHIGKLYREILRRAKGASLVVQR